ncbi:MAG: ABC transporter ATP-binding protein, partial [Stellaceae bacterium]
MPALLEVKDLHTEFRTGAGVVSAVDGVSYSVERGETVAIVGESGSGKTVGALSLLRLIPNPPGRITKGEILFGGRDLLQLSDEGMRQVRGGDIGMIFQEPMTSLNPVLTIGRQVTETLEQHRGADRATAHRRAIEVLGLVGIADPERRLKQYPHQLSGGMRQRVAIARTLALRPRIILMDEPFGALDPHTRMNMQDLLVGLWREVEATVFFVTHSI